MLILMNTNKNQNILLTQKIKLEKKYLKKAVVDGKDGHQADILTTLRLYLKTYIYKQRLSNYF